MITLTKGDKKLLSKLKEIHGASVVPEQDILVTFQFTRGIMNSLLTIDDVGKENLISTVKNLNRIITYLDDNMADFLAEEWLRLKQDLTPLDLSDATTDAA